MEGNSVSLINGHIDRNEDYHKLEVAFKHINYKPIAGAACHANLYNQFSETALEDIITQLIEFGVTFKNYDTESK